MVINMKNRRVIAFLLAALMSANFTFFACSKKGEETDGGIQSTTPQDETIQETTVAGPELPDTKYNDYNFRFLVNEWDPNGYWGERAVFAEVETGEPINDAVYRRNRFVEDKFGILISEKRTNDVNGQLIKVVKAGTHDYDIAIPTLNGAAVMATAGYLADIKSTMPYIDVTNPWWDQRAAQMLTIGNKLYMLVGDMTIRANEATWVIMFNKKVAEQNALGSLYSYVKNDTWYYDKFIELTKSVTKDLNGDGKYNEEDSIGLLTDTGSVTIMHYNTGESVARKDENDMPYLTLNTERATMVGAKIFEFLSEPTAAIFADIGLKHISNPWTNGVNKMFKDDKGLFYMISLTVMDKMRDMDSDFGVLPFPKFDENQKEYYHCVQPGTAGVMVFPKTTQNFEMASAVVESLCYESTSTVKKAFFDITITNKTIRDEESGEMLDLIFKTRFYDLGYIFNWNNIGFMLQTIFPQFDKFTSKYESMEAKTQTEIQKTIDEFESIE